MSDFHRVKQIFSHQPAYFINRPKTDFDVIKYDDTDFKSIFKYDSIYSHQQKAFDCILKNKDLLLVSPTNSGKTLSYIFPIYKKWKEDKSRKFLFIFPTKSLVNAKYAEFCKIFPKSEVVVYNGDVETQKRRAIRQKAPSIIIFTPELFYQSFVCMNQYWNTYYNTLYAIVLDEIHVYSGYFGASFSWILERFLRICKLHKIYPVLISCSGTVQSVEFIKQNFYIQRKPQIVYGEEIRLADQLFGVLDGSVDQYVQNIVDISKDNSKTLIFGRSRKEVEHLCLNVKKKCAEEGLSKQIYVYRGGLGKEERLAIEKNIEDGKFDIVIATSALEVGLDIKDLDNVIIYGYPYSRESFFQRIGRAGRTSKRSVVLCMLLSKKLDIYYKQHAETILDEIQSDKKKMLFDRNCEYIRNTQLWGMSIDHGISVYEESYKLYKETVDWLVETGVLYDKLLSFEGKLPGPELNIREFGKSLEVKYGPNVIGSVDIYHSLRSMYKGRKYIHQGVEYVVDKVLKSGVYIKDATIKDLETEAVGLCFSMNMNNFDKIEEKLKKDVENFGYYGVGDVYVWNDIEESYILSYDNVSIFCVEYDQERIYAKVMREALESFYESVGISFRHSIQCYIEKFRVVFYDTDVSGVTLREFVKYYTEYFKGHSKYKLEDLVEVEKYQHLKKFFKGTFKKAVFAQVDGNDVYVECVSQLDEKRVKKISFDEFVEIAKSFRLIIGFFDEGQLSLLDSKLDASVYYVNMKSSIDVVGVSYKDLLYCYGLPDDVESVRKIYERGENGYLKVKSDKVGRIQCLWN